MSETRREPLIHISRRAEMAWYKALGIRIAAIVLALAACSLICLVMTGENPIEIFNTMIKGAFSTTRKTWTTIHQQILTILPDPVGIQRGRLPHRGGTHLGKSRQRNIKVVIGVHAPA